MLWLKVVLPDGELVTLGGPARELPGLDLVGAFVGSEGTFGIATEVWVRLTRVPERVRLLFFAFATLEEACRVVSTLVAAGVEPAALEMIDRKTIEVVEDSIYACGLPRAAGAVLLVELDGLAAQVDQDTEGVRALAASAFETRVAESAADRLKLWKGRKVAFGALGRLKPDLYVQDAVVPRSKLAEVLRDILAIAREQELTLSNVFHAGDGNLHPNISYDGRDAAELERVQRAGRRILEVCIAAGGALTGEHGIGREKRDFMPLLFSEADLDVFRRLRDAWNRDGLCNPEKVLPGPKVCVEFLEDRAHPAGADR